MNDDGLERLIAATQEMENNEANERAINQQSELYAYSFSELMEKLK